MGDETTKRTRNELVEALRQASELSIEREKEKSDDLKGLGAVRQALVNRQIEAKIYRLAKFHAKAYLMMAKPPSPVNFGIVGSSNFTEPGLCRNLELNLFTTEQHQLQVLQHWFERCWPEAEENWNESRECTFEANASNNGSQSNPRLLDGGCMIRYPNLPRSQWRTQRMVEAFNAEEALWHRLERRSKRRRKVLRRLSRKQHEALDLLEFAAAKPPVDCIAEPQGVTNRSNKQ